MPWTKNALDILLDRMLAAQGRGEKFMEKRSSPRAPSGDLSPPLVKSVSRQSRLLHPPILAERQANADANTADTYAEMMREEA